MIEEDKVDNSLHDKVTTRRRPTRVWNWFGRRVPRGEIVFFCQMVIIYAVVSVALFNLTRDREPDKLWVALLGSCLGYVLPNPSIDSPSTLP